MLMNLTPYRARTLTNHNVEHDLMNPFADSFFRAFFGEEMPLQNFRVDVEDQGDHYLLKADLPGVTKENVKVEVQNGVLTIAANLDEKTERKERAYVCHERRTGSMRRSFNLEGIQEEAVEASYQDGVLTLKLPKVKEETPVARQIEIR